jgi:hypothetical protein
MDKKDLLSFFQELRLQHGEDFYNQVEKMNDIMKIFENYNVTKLDIKRIYRYLDKNVKKDVQSNVDEIEDDDDYE